MDQLIGRCIGDRYQIVSRVGVGAVATIYRARETSTGTEVAVKVVRSEIGRNPTVSARFQREVKAASKLDHPGIVRVLDWGLDGDMPWLAMELIEGEDLFEVLDRAGPLPQAWSVAVAMRVCEALEAAHGEGVVHRDLKPENIMLTVPDPRTGEQLVKVLDFGIAKLVGPLPGDLYSDETVPQVLTKAGSAVGTPSHMAPEQARGGEIDGRADIYAVGVLLYEMITGHLPFEGTNPMLVAIQQVRDEPPSPRLHLPSINPSLERLILRMLEKAPADRPQSASALAGELLTVLAMIDDGDDPTVRNPSTASTISAISGRHQVTITEIKARTGREDDDDDDEVPTRMVDDGPSTHLIDDDGPSTRLVDDDGPTTRLEEDDDEGPSTRLIDDEDGPSTRLVDDDGPSTRLVEDDHDEPSTRLVEDDDGPSTRLVEDDGPSTRLVDDGPATRLTVPRPGPKIPRPAATTVIEDEWDGTTERVFLPDDLAERIADPDGEDVTLRRDPLEGDNRFDIVDELTNLDRRPKSSGGVRHMPASVQREEEPPEVATRIVDPPPDLDWGPGPRPPMDSEAPVATVVVDADPLVAAAKASAARMRGRTAAGLGTAPLPRFEPPSEGDAARDDGGGARPVRRAAYLIEDGDSEAPVATVVADQGELVEAARRSRNVAARITGEVPKVADPTPRPPVGNAVLEAPPPPPPASEPGSSHPAPFPDRPYDDAKESPDASFVDRRYDQLPGSSTPHFPPRPEDGASARPRTASGMDVLEDEPRREVRMAARSGMDHPAAVGSSTPSPDQAPPGTAPGVDAPLDWQSPISRNYAGELEDMLRQMPRHRGRPVFTILLVSVLVSIAIAVFAWVVYY